MTKGDSTEELHKVPVDIYIIQGAFKGRLASVRVVKIYTGDEHGASAQ